MVSFIGFLVVVISVLIMIALIGLFVFIPLTILNLCYINFAIIRKVIEAIFD